MSGSPTVIKGSCVSCGAGVSRELPPEGAYGRLLRRLPLVCETCIDLAEEAEAQAEAQTRGGRARRDAEKRAARSGVPEHLRTFGFDDVEMKPELELAVSLAREWAEGVRHGALLAGPVGVGKTRVAVAAANHMLRRRWVHFYSAPLLLARLGTGELGSPARDDVVNSLTGTSALVIDDLDKARPSAYAAEVVFLAIDARADGAAPLFITTNAGSAELAERWPEPYGDAILSRLMLLDSVRVEGADRRRERP